MKDLRPLALRLLHVRYVAAADNNDLVALWASWANLQRYDDIHSTVKKVI